jgi:NAD-dependent dihydropyrimidine dehydrogenase PreA subunit
MVIV